MNELIPARIPNGTRVVVIHDLGEELGTVISAGTFPCGPVGPHHHQYWIRFDDDTTSTWGSAVVRPAQ